MKYWFKPKRFGYGLTPSSWEGWVMTFGFVAVMIGLLYFNGLMTEETVTVEGVCYFVVESFMGVLLFVYFAKSKTDGELKWRWGKEE